MKLAIVVCGKSPTTMAGGLGSYSYNIAKIFHELGYTVHLLGYGDKDVHTVLDFGFLHQIRNPYLKLVSFGNFLIVSKMVAKSCEIIGASNAGEVIIYGAAIWGKVAIDVQKYLSSKKIKMVTMASYFTTYKHEYEGQIKGGPVADYGFLYNFCLRALLLFISFYHSRQEHGVLENIDKIVVHYESAINILTEEFPDIDVHKIW